MDTILNFLLFMQGEQQGWQHPARSTDNISCDCSKHHLETEGCYPLIPRRPHMWLSQWCHARYSQIPQKAHTHKLNDTWYYCVTSKWSSTWLPENNYNACCNLCTPSPVLSSVVPNWQKYWYLKINHSLNKKGNSKNYWKWRFLIKATVIDI